MGPFVNDGIPPLAHEIGRLIRTYHRFADWPLEALPPQEVPDKSSSTTG
jgi:hypothetical protein